MAQHTVTLNGTAEDLNYFCDAHGYDAEENGTKLEFLDEKIKEFANAGAKQGKLMELNETRKSGLDAYNPGF